MKPNLIFTVVVFIKLLVLYFQNSRDIFEVVFELFIDKIHEILSGDLILGIKFRLHLVEKRLLHCVRSFLRGDMRHGHAAAASATAASLTTDGTTL